MLFTNRINRGQATQTCRGSSREVLETLVRYGGEIARWRALAVRSAQQVKPSSNAPPGGANSFVDCLLGHLIIKPRWRRFSSSIYRKWSKSSNRVPRLEMSNDYACCAAVPVLFRSVTLLSVKLRVFPWASFVLQVPAPYVFCFAIVVYPHCLVMCVLSHVHQLDIGLPANSYFASGPGIFALSAYDIWFYRFVYWFISCSYLSCFFGCEHHW